MDRNSIKYWMQDRPLHIQVWLLLSLFGTAILLAALLYALLFLLPAGALDAAQWRKVGYLFLMILIANFFVAKVVTERITEPFEKLAENLSRVKNKNWSDKILQVSRKDEIGCIINTLSQIQRNVVEINEDEEFFYQSVSHGLKTPIMVIQNCCTAYQDGIYGDEAIDIIMKESLALERDIRKLLYVNSFDHMLGKQSEFTAVSLDELLENCRKRFTGNERGIRITVPAHTGFRVPGNAESLQTVFDNLLENDLRYARSYVRVTIAEEKQGLHLTFENDGDPIEPKVLDRLFEKFYKSTDGNFGLGLFIAKKIVLFHKGEIWADNFEDGVRFHVVLRQNSPRLEPGGRTARELP